MAKGASQYLLKQAARDFLALGLSIKKTPGRSHSQRSLANVGRPTFVQRDV